MLILPLLGALALFGLAVQPASAQMCGGAQQQAQASTPAQGGMCGGMGAAAEDDPMADKPAAKPKAAGMCACCGRMAMMRGGQSGGSGGMQHDNMPGMGQPKQ
jgi:hypothetical protein